MYVSLRKHVERLGYPARMVSAHPGYANMYHLPLGYAEAATVSARKVLAENLKQRAHKEDKLVKDAESMTEKLTGITLTIPMKAEEGRVFGSVTAANIADALAKEGVNVDRKNITVDQVKALGEHEAKVRLYKRIEGTVKFNVVAEE